MVKVKIGRNVEVYMDNVLKNQKVQQHIDDMYETFEVLRKYWMKIEPGIMLSWKCNRLVASKDYNGSLGGWQPLIGLYPGPLTDAFHSFRHCEGCFTRLGVKRISKAWSITSIHPYLAKRALENHCIFTWQCDLCLSIQLWPRKIVESKSPSVIPPEPYKEWNKDIWMIEELVFSLVMSTKKLRPYFQAHTIKVLTD